MKTETIWYSDTIEAHQCGQCSIWFGVPSNFLGERRRDGKTFYCPLGHARVYRVTDIQGLQKKLDREREYARQQTENFKAERRSHIATKGKLTKTKNRIAKGVCPCCNRSFTQLERHIATQHPEFSKVSAPKEP